MSEVGPEALALPWSDRSWDDRAGHPWPATVAAPDL